MGRKTCELSWVNGSTFVSYGDSTQLLYLRSRFYNPADGRFQSRDTWGGDTTHPITLNKWVYGYSNPIQWTDPSGYDPNCKHAYPSFCAYQRMLEIVNEEKPNGVNALIKLFNDSELYTKWGSYAGRTNQTRLIWVLNVTRGSGQGGGPEYIPGIKWKNLPKELIDDLLVCGIAPLQLGIDFGGDNGFSSEFQDQKFYQDSDRWNSPGHLSTQVQHFLTAVAQSFPFSSINHLGQNLGLRAIIGHEKIDDRTNSEWAQIQSTKDSDIDHWFNAIEADKIGDKAQRDSELWAILNFGSEIAFGDVDPNRFGNSLQDLRLSLKGHRFYTWIQQHKSGSPNQAASWLAQTLTGR